MVADRYIPVAAPTLAGNERVYVIDCLDSTWISSNGKYIERFEEAFARFCGVEHAVSCSNGTTALHLALLALGVGLGDEIIVPTLTFIATANAVVYCGATPVMVDSEPRSWNIDSATIEAKITPRTKGIIVVHLYGHPADMDPIMDIARRHGLFVIEDAAEAHGALYKGRTVGSIGDIATFSFYGNKIVTTGEGGMLTTNDAALARTARLLKGQGQDPNRRYWFPMLGYNYRMTNIAAAIGLAQMEKADWHIQRRLEVASWYREELGGVPDLRWQPELPWARNVYWMFTASLVEGDAERRDEVMVRMRERGIETRPVFYPMHTLPPYRAVVNGEVFPVAERLAATGINLPTWAGLARNDVSYVCSNLVDILR